MVSPAVPIPVTLNPSIASALLTISSLAIGVLICGAIGSVVSVAKILVGSDLFPALSVAVTVMVSPSTNGVPLVSTV